MGLRKCSKPNLLVGATPQAMTTYNADDTAKREALSTPVKSPRDATKSQDCPSETLAEAKSDTTSLSQTCSSRGWYSSGTWPRIQKSTPSTQVARETILADTSKNAHPSPDFSRFEPGHLTPSDLLLVTKESFTSNTKRESEDTQSSSSTIQLPAIPVTFLDESRGNVNMASPEVGTSDGENINITLSRKKKGTARGPTSNRSTAESNPEPSSSTNVHKMTSADEMRPLAAPSWLEWLMPNTIQVSRANQSPAILSPGCTIAIPELDKITRVQTIPPPVSGESGKTTSPVKGGSWLGLWPSSASKLKVDMVSNKQAVADMNAPDVPSQDTNAQNNPTAPLPGSTWAFWYKDSGKSVDEAGELAITGETSQNYPAPAHTTTTQKSDSAETAAEKQRKGEKPSSIVSTTSRAESPKPMSTSRSTVPSKPLQDNLLLPSLRGTYHLIENPSIIRRIACLLNYSRQPRERHVCLLKEAPKVKKAIAIGIHGLFPAALLRTVIGQPTGTSIRFANHAAAAIHRWAVKQGTDCEIEKIALEGEGKVAERVDNLWKLLLNWIDHVRYADFIMVACHSQGVPVAIMLVAKLIEFGVVTTTRIGVCAMGLMNYTPSKAGVSLGPFAEYKSRLLSGSAAELFDFAMADSEVSKRYEHSLRVALKYGVRIAYTGSIDDQLVSLESALFAPANHPYIYRSVFVDGRVHAPDFIAHLVGFTLKLRNIGVSDHGTIRELSAPLAGSLYTGEGHSRLYDEAKIYDVAVEFTLETTSIGDIPLQMDKYVVPTNSNPFQLPWSMRGLLEEEVVKTDLEEEVKELLRQFNDWKPSTKVLKDVKYRLEAVKSKL